MLTAILCPATARRFIRLSVAILALWLPLSSRGVPAEKPPPPAKLKISGYGLLGNRELKRILRTLELGGKKPDHFDAGFVEDAALILAARVKRDGYLHPAISIGLHLADGRQMQVQAEDLMDRPLPRPLRIVRADFRIHKGVLFHYQQLDFEGLHVLSEKQARSYFVETDVLFHPQSARIYTPEGLRHGISSLVDMLDQLGYAEAKVEATRLRVDDKTGAFSTRITVHEGPKFLVHSVREQFIHSPGAEPEPGPTLFPNHPYSKLWLQDFTLSLRTNLYRLGYPDTAVQMKTLARHAESNLVTLDLQAEVKPGPEVRIAGVEFRGQKKARQRLMSRRVRIRRGDLLDPVRVEEGRYRLARLGIFDSVGLDYRTESEHLRDVIYDVKERQRLNVSLLFGWGSYELLRGGVEADLSDIWGLAHQAHIKAVQSFKATSGEFTYTVPELVGRDVDVFLHASGLRREEVSFTRVEYGGGVGLHKYFPHAATDLSTRYNYQILNAQDFTSFQEVATEGLTNPAVGSITTEIKYDRRDNPLYPRSGHKLFATFETGTSYLGGEANYERIVVSPSWHHSLGGGRYLSLGLSHGVDISFGAVADNLPFVRRFFPGGANSIRGYQEGEASPRNSLGQFVGAETYTLLTVELEQALTPKWSLVLFSDSLGFARRLEDYPFDTGLFSVGIGVRWRTLIGPVRLEYGHNLNPRKDDPSGTLQFSLGFPF